MTANKLEWTSEQMIENASNWSLAGDVALLNSLKKFSECLLSETVSISANVDNLLNNLESVSLKLDQTKNEFQSLRNTQFIENRVYEDDETLENNETKKEEKELTEEEKENAVKEAIAKGLKVMEKYFEKVEVAVSDSEEEENEKSYILRPIDPYVDRPLPYLVGSQEWYKKWHVGLLPSDTESESEKEQEVYSSSDSEECLPKDRILGSETSSELEFTHQNTGPVANSTFNDSQDRRREVFHSSDEGSEQSHSLPAKTPLSNENFAEQLAAKLGDVITGTAENQQQVNRNTIKKMKQPTKYGNLFSDEPPPLDDFDDTVLPKSAHQGLFSGGQDLFADNNEDELLWGQQNKTSQSFSEKEASTGHSTSVPKSKISKGLFDKSDSSSEEDMFTVAEKRKAKISQPYLQPFKPTIPFVDDQPPELPATADGETSKKKPIGGVSIFGEKANIFGENSGKPGFESKKSVTTTQVSPESVSRPDESISKTVKNKSLFDESSEEPKTPPNEIKVSKKSEKSVKKISLFDESSDEDLIGSKNKNTVVKQPDKSSKKTSLFDESSDEDTKRVKPSTRTSLFDKSSDEELPKNKNLVTKMPENQQSSKNLNLFDDTDHNKTEEKKKINLFDDLNDVSPVIRKDTVQKSEPIKENSLPDQNQALNITSEEIKKPVKKISLFDDDDDFLKEEEDIFASVPKKTGLFGDSKYSKGLFEDIDSSDTSSKVSSTNEEADSKKASKGLFDDLETSHSLESLSEIDRVKDGSEKVGDKSEQIMNEETPKNNPRKTLFDDLETSGSNEDLLGAYKNVEANGKSGTVIKRVTMREEDGDQKKHLFEDIPPEGEEGLFGKSKNEIVGEKSSTLEEQSGIKTKKDFETSKPQPSEKRSPKSEEGTFEVKNKTVKSTEVSREQEDILKEAKSKDIEADEKPKTGVFDVQSRDQREKIKEVVKNNDNEDKRNDIDQDDLEQFKIGNVKSKDLLDPKQGLNKAPNNTEDGVIGQNEAVPRRRKNVCFLDSDSESFSDDTFGFKKETEESVPDKKKTVEDEIILSKENTGNVGEQKLAALEGKLFEREQAYLESVSERSGIKTENSEKSTTHQENLEISADKNYSIPPPIDLFDPTPPPPDPNWDAASDNSGESDTFSLTDGILDRTNYNQFQTRSSLFDEAPPSLDANDSSGIVRDLNVTRVETDDSSFYPYASSSRRLSSDIFGEQQSQDSFFVTRNRTESSALSSGKIPENIENLWSKIENLTPSGNIEDFEGSSIFERSENESKESKIMGNASAIPNIENSEPPKIYGAGIEDNRDGDILSPKKSVLETEKPDPPKKASPGKIKHNFKINVEALMPGATPPKIHSTIAKSPDFDDTDKSATSVSAMGTDNSEPSFITVSGVAKSMKGGDKEVVTASGNDGKFENLNQTSVLHSATKDRARIPVKRRPLTRKARKEAVRKSMAEALHESEEDLSIVENQLSENEKYSQDPTSDIKNSFLNDLNDKLKISDSISNKQTNTSEDTSKIGGVSLVFGENMTEKRVDLLEKKVSEFQDIDVASKSSIVSKTSVTSESKSIFEDSFENASKGSISIARTSKITSESIKKTKITSIFGGDGSSSDEELFSGNPKSHTKDMLFSKSKPLKTEEISTKKDSKPSIFSDKSDSGSDSEIFGGNSKLSAGKMNKKIIGEASKKTNIFEDSGNSSEEDLFGSRTSKSRSESGNVSANKGPILGKKRVESTSIKVAGVKKLENKEVTDFDPLSAFK